MNSTAPDPEARDEALGAELDQLLEALGRGGLSTTPSEGELGQLQPVVARLFRLAQGLAMPTTIDYPAPPAPSTIDAPRDQADTSQPRPEASAPAAEVPTCVGKFQVVRALGRGGQAATLLAFDPDLCRHVVLKLYHAARAAREQEQVLREGQALARVRSPYVAQCHSAERHEGIPFLVMEYIPGRNLTEEHRTRPLTVARALEVVGRLAEGLAAVHACGLLHRDVKPANVLLGEDGRPRLVDFGLAAPLASDDLANLSGTLAYMAPEQARRQVERIDARTDLYGLGAVLYDLLTGRPPHVGASRAALHEAACTGDVTAPLRVNPALPRAVSDLCLRCLARDPADRFASAAELAEAIRRVQRPRPRWPLLAAIAAGVAAAALLVAALANLGGPPERPREVVADRADGKPVGPKKGLELTAKGDGQARDEGPKNPEARPMPVKVPYLNGRKLRRDFPLEVRVDGGTVDADTGLHHLRDGQTVHFFIEAGKDAYVGLWNVTDKRTIRLFPNEDEEDNFLPTGTARRVPGSQAEIVARHSGGVEYVHVLAATRPFRNVSLPELRHALIGPYAAYNILEAHERFKVVLRDLELVPRPRFFDRAAAASEVIIPLQVLPRDGQASKND
jgi:hypothetical protein